MPQLKSSTQERLDLKIDVAEKGVANGVATLDATGKLDVAQLPALSLTETFVVNSQAAMLALNAQTGDIAIRTDINKTFILTASPATTLANWQEILFSDAVTSVNGKVGAVSLTAADVGAEPANPNIQSHIAATNNPHNVTAAQVGAISSTLLNVQNGVESLQNSANLAPSHGIAAFGGRGITIPTDTNLETWALDTANNPSGLYSIVLTVPQGNLPAGEYYIEVLQFFDATTGNRKVLLRATSRGVTTAPYQIWINQMNVANSGFGGWRLIYAQAQRYTLNVAVSNMTTVTAADLTPTGFSYTPGVNQLYIHIDGVYQHVGSYTETNSTTITFSQPLPVGSNVEIEVKP